MTKKCEKFTVSGIVQGVGFRYHTVHQGMLLGLTGYALNLNDGDVEVVVCGTEEQISKMAQWLTVGPRTATVDNVVRGAADLKEYKGFKIL
ncbi:acylphosphatase [Vibrio marisflavi]|uniref:acylphosphatase n=1 Tax=Vibrio marisflavi CECT 7928 TaxID=634439 RepID=A0ABM9A4Y7_9VIBR|nr:acylphosphatase [Vibrio marisflavi]CAH0539736.1 Acylphosphatase [Vibrio marisflavi CECT 7928]